MLVATISFFVLTATSANIGTDFLFRQDTYGWPNRFLTITYEKAKITDLDINTANMWFNYGLSLAIISSIRLMFFFMKVKRRPLESLTTSSVSPAK